jgi:hypothetical protein
MIDDAPERALLAANQSVFRSDWCGGISENEEDENAEAGCIEWSIGVRLRRNYYQLKIFRYGFRYVGATDRC